jgi:hypothetical protein
MPEIDVTKFVGGDLFVAVLEDYTLPFSLPGSSEKQEYLSLLTGTVGYGAWSVPSGWTANNQFYVPTADPSATQYFGNALNVGKIDQELGQMANAAAKFNTFQTVLYQYNTNPTLISPVEPGTVTPNPGIPDSMADTILAAGAPFISRKTFTSGDLTSMLNQLLADALAFFPALP